MSAASLLAPLSWLYGAAVRLRNRRWDRPGAARSAGVPVISVGNLTVGGTGKTPLAAWLCRRLLAVGRHPAVVSRGYRGGAGAGPLVVSRGGGPEVPAALGGDEPWMLARQLPGVPVVVGSDRVAGAAAARGLGADVIVLDDGFQHRRLRRDLDLVLVDATRPLGEERLLPAGRLREPLASLARADVVIATRVSGPEDTARIAREVRPHNPRAPVVAAAVRSRGFVDALGREAPVPVRVLGFCAIGNPGSFRAGLEGTGAALAGFRAFRDHHRFRPRELARLCSAAAQAGAALVTTEKDLARIGATRPDGAGAQLLALRVEFELPEPGPLLDAVARALGEPAP